MSHLHYGGPQHRVRHFAWKAVGVFLIAAVVPATLGIPDAQRMFILVAGIAAAGWFVILAIGEKERTREAPFHWRRAILHSAVLVWLGAVTFMLGTRMLTPEQFTLLQLFALMAAVHPAIALASHLRRLPRENRLRLERQEATAAAT
ncbi:MAG: hypothetical protein V4480_00240 [Patescibacteria group bacterium]